MSGILLFYGKTLLRSLGPVFAYLALMIPPPVDILYGVGTTLANLSYSTIHGLVSLTGLPVIFGGGSDYGVTLISAAGQSVQLSIAVQCSGIYSLLGFGALGAFLLLEQRDHMRVKLTSLAVGVPILFSLNVIRVTTMILMAYQWGEGVAVDTFHFVGGFLLALTGAFIALRFGWIVLRVHDSTQRNSEFPAVHHHPWPPMFCSKCARNRKITIPGRGKPYALGAILAGALLILTLSLPVMAVTNHGVALVIYSSRGAESSSIFPNSGGWTPYFVSRDLQYERLVGEDGAYWYRFVRVNAGSAVDVFALLELSPTVYAHASAGLSNPSYMSTSGFSTLKIYPVTISQAPPIVGWFSTMEKTDQSSTIMSVLTWSQKVSVEINGNVGQRLVATTLIAFPGQFEDAGLLQDSQDYIAMNRELSAIASSIISNWSVVETSATLAKLHETILSNSDAIIGGLVFAVPILVAFHVTSSQRNERRLRHSFDRLSSEDKKLLVQCSVRTEQGKARISGDSDRSKCSSDDQSTDSRINRLFALGMIQPDLQIRGDVLIVAWRSKY